MAAGGSIKTVLALEAVLTAVDSAQSLSSVFPVLVSPAGSGLSGVVTMTVVPSLPYLGPESTAGTTPLPPESTAFSVSEERECTRFVAGVEGAESDDTASNAGFLGGTRFGPGSKQELGQPIPMFSTS